MAVGLSGGLPGRCGRAPCFDDRDAISHYCDGGSGAGIALSIGGRDLRYANIALRSSSVIFPISCHGIGGSISRDVPMNFPVLSDWINNASFQFPIPVAGCGVRLYEKLTPHGPTHAVISFVVIAPH